MAKRDNAYFAEFITMVEYSCQAAEFLQKAVRNYNPDELPELRRALHKIEHNEDMLKHDIMKKLVREFVPPIDREDIIQLANELDDVTDKIEDVLIRIDMYNVREMRPKALEFVDVIVRCCQALRLAMVEFPNFHKSTTLKQTIIDVNTMEEEGDEIYINAMRELYRTDGNPIDVTVWSELFDRLEDCCDACEHVSDILEIIIMKNS